MIRSTKSESLLLYRDILRATRMFTWLNDRGVPWSQVLRENTRKEFEQARFESDPAVITRLLYVGRDCLAQTTDKYFKAQIEMDKNIDKTRNN